MSRLDLPIGTHERISFPAESTLNRTNVSMDGLDCAYTPRGRYRATHEKMKLSKRGFEGIFPSPPFPTLHIKEIRMKTILTELVEEVLFPVAIISAALIVAFVFYVALGYLLIIKMLLRELFLLLDSKSTGVTVEAPAIEAAIEVSATEDETEVETVTENETEVETVIEDVTEVTATEDETEAITVTENEEVELIAPEKIEEFAKPLTIYELRALGRAARVKGASRLTKASLQLALGII